MEVRRDWKCYPLNSLYQLCCGLRHLNDCGRPEVNMLQQAESVWMQEWRDSIVLVCILLRSKLNRFLGNGGPLMGTTVT